VELGEVWCVERRRLRNCRDGELVAEAAIKRKVVGLVTVLDTTFNKEYFFPPRRTVANKFKDIAAKINFCRKNFVPFISLKISPRKCTWNNSENYLNPSKKGVGQMTV
jgi:hypothetical protein